MEIYVAIVLFIVLIVLLIISDIKDYKNGLAGGYTYELVIENLDKVEKTLNAIDVKLCFDIRDVVDIKKRCDKKFNVDYTFVFDGITIETKHIRLDKKAKKAYCEIIKIKNSQRLFFPLHVIKIIQLH